ncbi:beta-lactamase family protein [Algoriphagus aestuariicola]|uniref:Beta-lactamase family protein n=1 Tax=Algoriphagus aestuariicola TaxID=1852016 RepID=A0ABS3BL67_9BACT|nr:serine hydrolase domain-containing protein [Algoriphagus aestuariicola]MBN7800052.1 beta-lactamase family protein [Algoriphagus aestuariicola]
MKNLFFTAMLFGFWVNLALAQSFDKAKLDRYFDALEESNRFMGSVAVSENGHVIYSRSLGYVDVERAVKANENSKYRIGSISKTFTSVLVLKAVEENRLGLDQTIEKYFPTVPNAEKITLKQLLSHRSGIHNFTDDQSYMTWFTQPKSEADMVAIIAAGGSDFEPESKASYSNSNYVLLTYILEKEFGKSYGDLIQENIVQPIGLKNTYFGGTIDSADNECKSYSFDGAWVLQPETDLSIPLGAGGIVSTPIDLNKFSDALFGGKILQPESLKLMTAMRDNFGFGLFPIPFYEKISYGHTGGIDGFTSVFSHFSDGSVSYALTSNGSNYNGNNITIAVLSALFDKPYEIPTFNIYEVSSEELDSYLGVYASTQIPLKITITRDKNSLLAQATGQSAFPLEATEKNVFKFDPAGIVMEFDPEKNAMILTQGGQQVQFKKE